MLVSQWNLKIKYSLTFYNFAIVVFPSANNLVRISRIFYCCSVISKTEINRCSQFKNLQLIFFFLLAIQRFIAIIKCYSEIVRLQMKNEGRLTIVFMQKSLFFTFSSARMSSMSNLTLLDSEWYSSFSSSMPIARLNHTIALKNSLLLTRFFPYSKKLVIFLSPLDYVEYQRELIWIREALSKHLCNCITSLVSRFIMRLSWSASSEPFILTPMFSVFFEERFLVTSLSII